MSKKLVRLTEGDLHRIIKESVEQILSEVQLNELDSRTYVNAARKRAEQGNTKSADELNRHAANMWVKKYGTPKGDIDRSKDSNGTWMQHRTMSSLGDGRFRVRDNNSFYSQDKDKGHHRLDTWDFYQDENKPTSLSRLNMYFNKNGNDSAEEPVKYYNDSDFENGDEGLKVAQQMAKGNGKYQKGKGWQ